MIKELITGKRRLISTILIVAILIALGFAIYLNFYFVNQCKTYDCFARQLKSCNKISFVSEQPEASWLYSVKYRSGSYCVVNVKLIQPKEGDLSLEKLSGYSMDCSMPLGLVGYPEKNLANCHGRLKEELQTVIINKLHSYLLENLGQVKEELTKAI